MSLEHAILGLLCEAPRTGYELKRGAFDDGLSPLWPADQAQIYRTLDRLRARKAVTVTRRRRAGRPDRLVYSITPEGADELDRWLSTSEPPPPVRDPLLLRLHFGERLSDEALSSVLAARRAWHQERLDDLRDRARTHGSDAGRSAQLRRAAIEGAIARERAAIDWIDDWLERIASGELAPIRVGRRQEPAPR